MIAVIFPGQGSQKPGMGQELAETYAAGRLIYEQVSEATGIDVQKLSWFEDEETLRRTENAQIGLFTASLAAYEVLRTQSEAIVSVVAGHSVGEFSALVAARVYSLVDAARLVKARGETMSREGTLRPGSMAAVLGLDFGVLAEICAGLDGDVAVANDNSPGQVVISGESSAVLAAGESATEAGAKRVIPLNVSGAFHSPLMNDAATKMRTEFDRYRIDDPTMPVYSNVTSIPEPRGSSWPGLLELQLKSAVRWRESVENMIADGVDTFVECGVGEVLGGLLRRIDKSVRYLKVNDSESLRETVAALG